MSGPSPSLGVLLWSQGADWPTFADGARRVDELGYAHLWTWDHLLPIFGDLEQPILEGWTALAALAVLTKRVRLGLLVTANTFRNPALVAKMASTVDQISDGRAILGLGGAWFRPEHEAYGIDFGDGVGSRLDRLDEAASIARRLLDGQAVEHAGAAYRVTGLRLRPPPIQRRLPLMIGGVGERKTLRTVARYADLWNAFGSGALLRHKAMVLRERCEELGRDPAEIEHSVAFKPIIRHSTATARSAFAEMMARNRVPMAAVEGDGSFWIGTPSGIAERMADLSDAGFTTFIAEMAAPYDQETLERLIGDVPDILSMTGTRGARDR